MTEKGKEYIEQEECYPDNAEWCKFIYPFLLERGYIEAEINHLIFSEVGIIKEKDSYSDEWRDTVGEELFDLAAEKTNKKII